ncbi:MAG TPA: SRPBCC family protein [Solirubrobacterales bacterium]|nr:SRPBCC family protein [Solirubrobacterales bacterium]
MSEQEAGQKATVTLPAEREIHVERTFEAPPERVFAAYTDPELVPQWWGPRGTTTIVEELDATAGGKWRFVMHDADGGETGFRGVFREVSPHERIVQTFEWEGMPGHVSVDTAVFEDIGDGRTRVVSTSVFHTPEERDGMLESGMERGMNETYERLDELLAQQS